MYQCRPDFMTGLNVACQQSAHSRFSAVCYIKVIKDIFKAYTISAVGLIFTTVLFETPYVFLFKSLLFYSQKTHPKPPQKKTPHTKKTPSTTHQVLPRAKVLTILRDNFNQKDAGYISTFVYIITSCNREIFLLHLRQQLS